MDSDFYRKAFLVATVVILGAALLRMLEPFWGALAWGITLAFLLYPLHLRLTRRLGGRAGASAAVLTALTPLIVLLPLTSLGLVFAQQVGTLIDAIQSSTWRPNAAWLAQLEQYPWIARILAWVREHISITAEQIQSWLVSGAQTALKSLAAVSGNLVLGAVGTLVGFFLMLFLLFFLLRDGREMLTRAVHLIPLPAPRRDALLQLIGNTTRAVVFGTGATALAQGVLVGIGFALVGLPSPVVFGALAAVLALLPAGGTAIVWAPAVVGLLLTGRWGAAIFLGVWGVGVAVSDNFLRPMLIGKYAPVSTLAVFVGVVGGVAAFGPIGLIAGPVLLTLIASLLQFTEESLARKA